MSNIPYPDVPPLPGVPPLSRAANQGIAAGLAVVAELYALYLKFKNTPKKYPKQPNQYVAWGIVYSSENPIEYSFKKGVTPTAQINTSLFSGTTTERNSKVGITGITINGTYALEPDSFVKFDYKVDHKIPNYPIEKGSFQSYNKVTLPYEIKLTVTKSGIFAITPFLAQIEILLNSTRLISVVTPDHVYTTTSLISFTYRKEATNGAVLLIAELTFQEVRVLPTPSAPAAVPQADATYALGQTSPQPLTPIGTNIPFTPPSFT